MILSILIELILACPPGYHGDNCTNICPSDAYGDSCGQKCTCSPCHHVYGCNYTTFDTGGKKEFNVTSYSLNKNVTYNVSNQKWFVSVSPNFPLINEGIDTLCTSILHNNTIRLIFW